jgi:hypothetical protein
MEPRGEPIKLLQTHLSNGDAKLSGFVSSDFAGHHLAAWEAIKGEANYVVYCAELCGIVV